jgi:hypothetical protein
MTKLLLLRLHTLFEFVRRNHCFVGAIKITDGGIVEGASGIAKTPHKGLRSSKAKSFRFTLRQQDIRLDVALRIATCSSQQTLLVK